MTDRDSIPDEAWERCEDFLDAAIELIDADGEES